jgi:hypothetical protein
MNYQEDEKASLRRQRAGEAISLAMQSRWQEAVSANKAIIELFPTDVDAYNRLGRALEELSEYPPAKEAYGYALQLDPANRIAKRNLERLSHLGDKQPMTGHDQRKVALHLFTKETGKSQVVNLCCLAPKETLSRMTAGTVVYLKAEGGRLIAESGAGEYLGEVEPKYGMRLTKLIKGGNKYTAAIAALDENGTKVIITEVFRHPSQSKLLSFPTESKGVLRPYARESLLKYEAGEGVSEEGIYLLEEEEEEEEPQIEGIEILSNEAMESESG